MNSDNQITPNPQDKVGWVDSPNGRGTINILWTCLVVLFTCMWSILHINVPAQDESRYTIIKRKFRWALMTLYAPEAITLLAASQWSSANNSWRDMQEAGVTGWTVAHSFFADAGGFILKPQDYVSFPVNSRAIHYLVKNKYIQHSFLSEDELLDRSKGDYFTKTIALVQSMYLLITSIARWKQSLGISPLECSTLAFVFCTLATYFFWMQKPLDVAVPIVISMDRAIADVLIEAGSVAESPWTYTPMDFVEQPGWSQWKRRDIFKNFDGMAERPIQRIPNDLAVPPLTLRLAFATWTIGVFYAAIHVTNWNFDFPTLAELHMWRGASLTLLVIYFLWGLVEVFSVKPGLDFTLTLFGIWEKQTTKHTLWRRWAVDAPATISAVLYYIARTMLIVQTLTCFRAMPAKIYMTVEWEDYLPHF